MRLSHVHRIAGTTVAALAATAMAVIAPAGAHASLGAIVEVTHGCSAKTMPGGDWPTYGHDLSNTRAQTAESRLPPLRAAMLAPAWLFDTGHPSEVLGQVDINSTPVVARGCVYVGDAAGSVFAIDADTGGLVWSRHIDLLPPGSGARSGTVVGTIAIAGNRAIVVVNQEDGPYVVALDADTGVLKWTSDALDTQTRAYSHASALVAAGVVFVGFSAAEGIPSAQGGFVLLDVASGHILKKTYTIPEADQALGYGGGGIWSTPAVDEVSRYAYVGTGNPFSKLVEHEHTNAILKIDIDRDRPTFGEIVASYKGTIEQYLPLLQSISEPACQLVPEDPAVPTLPPFLPPLEQSQDSFVTCLQGDLDFGSGANLFAGPDGTMLVGELQKSGVYHVARADTMGPEARVVVGVSCLVCNGASTAYDPVRRQVLADVAPGSLMASFSPTSGIVDWRSPIGDVIHYQPVAVAGGVAYTVDSLGFLDGFDEASGLPVLHRSLVLDGAVDAVAAFASSGVSIANHTVYAAAGSRIVAYRVPGVL